MISRKKCIYVHCGFGLQGKHFFSFSVDNSILPLKSMTLYINVGFFSTANCLQCKVIAFLLLCHPYVLLPVSLLLNSKMGMKVAACPFCPPPSPPTSSLWHLSVKPAFKDELIYFGMLFTYEIRFSKLPSVQNRHSRHSRKFIMLCRFLCNSYICDQNLALFKIALFQCIHKTVKILVTMSHFI